jgi:3D (Asp-Asp-Asp) domain-containing protein
MKTNSLFVALISVTLSTIIYASILKTREKNIPQTSPEAPQSIIISDSINVRVTCFRATVDECGNDLGICFDGSKVRKGIVALSPDLFYTTDLHLGDTIQILGTPLDGWYVITDKTAHHIKNTVDIFITKDEKGFSETGIIVKR